VKNTKLNILIFIIILLIALSIGLTGLDSEYLWYDEYFSVCVANRTLDQTIYSIIFDVHPPAFYLLLHYYIKLNLHFTIFYLRFLPMIINLIALIILFYFTKNFFNLEVAILSSLLFTFSNFLLQYSQEVRMYSLIVLLSITSSFSLLLMIVYPLKKKWLWLYALINILGVYTHYHFFLFLFSHLIFIIYAEKKINNLKLIFKRGQSFLIVIIAFSFWIKIFMNQINSVGIKWLEKPGLYNLMMLFFNQFPFWELHFNLITFILPLLIYAIVTMQIILLFRAEKNKLIPISYELALIQQIFALLIPVLIAFFISVFLKPIFHQRYLIFSLPPLLIIIAVGISQLKKWYIKLPLILLIIIPNLWAINKSYNTRTKPNWELAFEKVKENITSNPIIIFPDYAVYNAFKKYTHTDIEYKNYENIFNIYKDVIKEKKKPDFYPDILLIGYLKRVYTDMTILSVLEICARNTQTIDEGGLDIYNYQKVNLEPYFKKIETQRNELKEKYLYYLTSDSPTFDKSFYKIEMNNSLEYCRWSKGNKVEFEISPLLKKDNYIIDFDIDTIRPPLTPLPKINIFINDILVKSLNNIQKREIISVIFPLTKTNDKIKITFEVNCFSPSEYLKDNNDKRELGFKLYSIGIKKYDVNEEASQLKIDIGDSTTDEPFIISGFYGAEKGNFTGRWTNGKGELLLPLHRKFRVGKKLIFRAETSDPQSEGEEVSFYIDDKFFGSINVKRGTGVYEIPSDFDVEAGIHKLTIVSNVWKPSETIKSKDKRQLGISFDWIKIEE